MLLIQANGTQTKVHKRRFTHRDIEEILNCDRVTALALGDQLLFIDTNGVRNGKRPNEAASEMAKDVLYETSHYIAGNAFLVDRNKAPRKR